MQRLRAFAFERGGLLALAILITYMWIAPSHIVDGDNSEFATIGSVGGVPHPSGYPLFVLWLRLTSWLWGGSGAHTTAMATAILGGVAMLVLHAAARAWGARPLAATIAVAIYAASPVVLRIFTEAEVFALNALVVSTVLWLAARGGPLRGVARVAALCLVAGLGLSDHMTCVLVAPIGILGVVRGVREAPAARLRCLALGAGAFAIGLLPYAYFLLAPDTPISWRHMTGVGDLLHHFLRVDYGTGRLSPNRAPVPAIDSLGALFAMLARAWLWVLLVLGLATLGARTARPGAGEREETRWGWALLAASFVIAGPLFISRFNIPPSGIGLALCNRFHLLPALLLTVPVAAGLDWIGTRIEGRLSAAARSSHTLANVIAVVMFAAIAARSLPVHSPEVEHAVFNMLDPLPQDSVVIVSEDDLYFGAAYVELVLGHRPDVTVISYGQLLNPEYRQRLHDRTGILMLATGDKKPSLSIADDVMSRKHPMFVDAGQINILSTFPTYPFGSLFRVLPRDTPRPPIQEVFTLNKAIYDKFQLADPPPAPGDAYGAHVRDRYVYIWRIIERALAAAGDPQDAAVAGEIASTLAPR